MLNYRQNEPFRRQSNADPRFLSGFPAYPTGLTLDKTMNDRKHLTGLEFDHLLAGVKGSRNEACDRCLLLLMFRHGLPSVAA